MNRARTLIDCSVLEGGGQIIRNSFSLSAITGRPIQLTQIRYNRPNPGLSKQHLEVAKLIQDLSHGTCSGAEIRSTELDFCPGTPRSLGVDLDRNIGSAGAISLVIQSALPFLVAGHSSGSGIPVGTSDTTLPSTIRFVGGSNVPFSPPLDHTQLVLLPILNKMGVQATAAIKKRGYYPVGGGLVELSVTPSNLLSPLQLCHPSPIVDASCVIFGCGKHCTTELVDQFKRRIRHEIDTFCTARSWTTARMSCRIDIPPTDRPKSGGGGKGGSKNRDRDAHSNFGAQVCLLREDGVPISANVLFEGKGSDFVDVDIAVAQIMAQLAWVVDAGACVDEHATDQLIIFMALCAVQNPGEGGRSQILCAPRIDADVPLTDALSATAGSHVALAQSSLHIEAAIHIAQLFLDCAFTVEEVGPHKCRLISCVKRVEGSVA